MSEMDRPLVRLVVAGLACAFAVTAAALASEARPEADRSVSDWTEEFRFVGVDSQSPHPGKWKNDRSPYLIEPMDACQVENGISRVILTGGAQFGKSEVPLNAMAHMIDTAPRGAMVLLPSLEEVRAYSRLKWEANVDATPRWRSRVMARRSRTSEGSTTNVKRFRGGAVEFVTSGASKGLQMRTIGLLVCEEVAQYEFAVGEGGDPISAAEMRGTTFGDDFKTILCSTPGFFGRCRITDEYMASDQRRWFTPCPHCGDFHVLDFDRLTSFEGRPVFSCPQCGGVIEEAHKRAMNARGVWIATFAHEEDPDDPDRTKAAIEANKTNPKPPPVIPAEEIERWRRRDCEGRARGYHLWQAQSNLASWAVILRKWGEVQSGKGDPVEFSQKVLGVAHREIVDRPDWEKLHEARGLIYRSEGQVPPWAGMVTGAIDVQHNRLEWAVYAWGRGGVGARIASGIIAKDPADPTTWREDVHALVEQEFSGPAYMARKADYWGIDSGGHHTQEVYKFCQGRPSVLPLKGKSADKGDAPPLGVGSRVKIRVKGRVVGRVQLYLVGTHALKTRIYFGLGQGLASIDSEVMEPRALFFGRELSQEDCRQLTSEYLDRKDPREPGVWTCPQGHKNEQLDLAVYSLALAINEGLDRLDDRQWADRMAARAPDVVALELTPLEQLARQAPDLPRAEAVKPATATLSDEMKDQLKRLGEASAQDEEEMI